MNYELILGAVFVVLILGTYLDLGWKIIFPVSFVLVDKSTKILFRSIGRFIKK